MILYFSGTGNSEYAAKRIGREIEDEVVNLFEKIKTSDYSQVCSQRPWVVVVPTYAWRIPRIVEKWLGNTRLKGNRDIYFVMTCGENIGNAGKYLKQFCAKKKMNYCGCMEIAMPENYIALFSTPSADQALQILDQAEGAIDQAARFLKEKKHFPRPDISLVDHLSSGIVNAMF